MEMGGTVEREALQYLKTEANHTTFTERTYSFRILAFLVTSYW